jgi:hypothetical protein
MPLAEYLDGPKSAQPLKNAAPPAESEAEIRKKVFLQFGAMVVLGLALAGWYVGYRIFAAREATPPAPVPIVKAVVPAAVIPTAVVPPVAPESKPIPVIAPQPTPPPVESKPADLPAPIAPVAPIAKPVATKVETPKQPAIVHQQPIPKRKDSPAQPFKRHDASPRAGEKYLQIAAFGPRALDGFLKTLEGQGLHPVVAPGPVDNIYRILVGPFPNSTALEETRSLIKSSGVEPILRSY